MSASQQCHHPDLHFDSNHVSMGDSNVHYLEIKARCRVCDVPMVFRGLPLGLSPHQPTMQIDGQEVRLPMLGKGEEPEGTLIGFTGEYKGGELT